MSTPHEPKWIDQNWSTQLHRELSGSRAQFTSTCFALIGSKHNELGRIVLNTCIPTVADLEGTSRHRPPLPLGDVKHAFRILKVIVSGFLTER